MLGFDKRRRGLFVKLPSTEVIDLVAASGLDFAVVDLEHSQLSEDDARRLVRHAAALGFPALVRIPTVDRGAVNRLLEAGAAGIQLSTVRRVSQVAELRAACCYAPEGDRSISLSHPQAGYGAQSIGDYLRDQRERRPLLVAQIETAETDDPLEQVVGAGADVVFLGLTDLSVDLGLDAERVRARVDEVAGAAQRAGVALGAFGLDDPRVLYELASSDLSLLRAAVADAA